MNVINALFSLGLQKKIALFCCPHSSKFKVCLKVKPSYLNYRMIVA